MCYVVNYLEDYSYLCSLKRSTSRMVDIIENDIYKDYPAAFALLLKDQTTQKNIFWATHDYEDKGKGYQYSDEITIEQITGKNGNVIKPRVLKGKPEQTSRTKMKAEIFTPSWVCNIQNNVTDESWFGRKGVFNTEDADNMTWEVNTAPIEFSEDKTWKDYVSARRIEITCGEAPYLASRYDTTSGELIAIGNRIGLLDRKLRVVGENTSTPKEWLESAEIAYKNIYGDSCHDTKVSNGDMFNPIEIVTACEGCQTNNIRKHNGVYCLIKNWDEMDKDTGEMGSTVRFVDLLKR